MPENITCQELEDVKLALSVVAHAVLRMEYSKDCHHIGELEAISDLDLEKLRQLCDEKGRR